MSGLAERLAVVPEPYLVAEAMHLEKGVRTEILGEDLPRGSLVVDIGAATLDLCLVRGPFPGPGTASGSRRRGTSFLTTGSTRIPSSTPRRSS